MYFTTQNRVFGGCPLNQDSWLFDEIHHEQQVESEQLTFYILEEVAFYILEMWPFIFWRSGLLYFEEVAFYILQKWPFFMLMKRPFIC